MSPQYREEPCRNALNRVTGMPFRWSLNPYTGCVHRCTFCYVRAFERRADRPSDNRYGQVIRVKTNVAEVLARELARPSWKRELVAVGAHLDWCDDCARVAAEMRAVGAALRLHPEQVARHRDRPPLGDVPRDIEHHHRVRGRHAATSGEDVQRQRQQEQPEARQSARHGSDGSG